MVALEVIHLLKKNVKTDLKVGVIWEGEDYIPPFYDRHILPEGYIKDVLQDEVDLWTPPNPVLINTPPGSGKTSFVYEVLLPKAIAKGQNVLLVSNRTGLSDQEKYAVMDVLEDPNRFYLTPEGVRAQEDFGAVRVITYHRLPALVTDPGFRTWVANLAFVVFDEAHFFVADAVFNQNCDYILKLATKHFCHAVRLYLTATSEDIIEPLAKAEEENFRCLISPPLWYPPREFIWYHRAGNYDQYKLSFFNSLSEFIPKIQEDPNQKWIIFVDSKNQGKEFATELGKQVAVYIDAEKKSGKPWETILSGHLPSQVLVTTAVLDNGINIVDQDVKNVVIVADNRTALLQMLGRRRVSKDEKINLFIYNQTEENVRKRLQRYSIWLAYYKYYDANFSPQLRSKMANDLWHTGDPQLLKLFRLSDGHLYANELARHHLLRRCCLYKKILNGETSFQREVVSWLNLTYESDSPEISYQDLEDFYCTHGVRTLTADQKAELRSLVVSIYQASRKTKVRADRIPNLSHNTLNEYLNEMGLGYMIINAETNWHFVKFPPETTSS